MHLLKYSAFCCFTLLLIMQFQVCHCKNYVALVGNSGPKEVLIFVVVGLNILYLDHFVVS